MAVSNYFKIKYKYTLKTVNFLDTLSRKVFFKKIFLEYKGGFQKTRWGGRGSKIPPKRSIWLVDDPYI